MTLERFTEILSEYEIQMFEKPKNLEKLTEEEVREFAEWLKKQFIETFNGV